MIPTQGSQLDAVEAAKAIRLVRAQEQALRIRIPATILFTRTSAAIRPRGLAAIEAEFRRAGVPILATQIHEREAYRAIFSFGCTLSQLNDSQFTAQQIDNARANARALMTEIRPGALGGRTATPDRL